MDIFSMLQNAPIIDEETAECIGRSIGFEVLNGRMIIKANLFNLDDLIDDDPDDGKKEDIPDDDASNVVQKIHAIAGGKE